MSLSPVLSLGDRIAQIMRGKTLKDILGRGPGTPPFLGDDIPSLGSGPQATPPFVPQGTGDLLRRRSAGGSLLDELSLGEEEQPPPQTPLARGAGGSFGRVAGPVEERPTLLRRGETPVGAPVPIQLGPQQPSLLRRGETAGPRSPDDELATMGDVYGNRASRAQGELSQMDARPGLKQGLGGLAATAIPLLIAALAGGTEGLEGAASGVSEMQDRSATLRDSRRKELMSEIEQDTRGRAGILGDRADVEQRNRASAATAARQAPLGALNQNKLQLEIDALQHPRLSLEQAYSQAVQEGDLDKAKTIRDQMGKEEAAKRAPEKAPALSDTEQRVQDYLASKGLPNTPKNRDDASVAIANRNTAQPTEEDARGAAQDILAHRLAPSQMSSIYGGFGTAAQKFKRMVIAEARKIDPQFDYEQAESEYQFAKTPGFQNTVRYMSSVQESIPLVIDRAKRLASGKVRSINALVNAGKNQFNNIDLRKFQTDRLLVADEIAKILQGGGTGSGTSDAKLQQAGKILQDTDSPEVIASTLADVNELLGYRKKSLVRGTYMDRGGADSGAPPSAEAEVFGKDGKTLLGHVVNGKFVPLSGGQNNGRGKP